MFESLRATLSDLLGGRVAPGDRRGVIAEMKRALVQAKLGIEDLHESVDVTRRHCLKVMRSGKMPLIQRA